MREPAKEAAPTTRNLRHPKPRSVRPTWSWCPFSPYLCHFSPIVYYFDVYIVAVHHTSCLTSFYSTWIFLFLLNTVFHSSYKEDSFLLRCGIYCMVARCRETPYAARPTRASFMSSVSIDRTREEPCKAWRLSFFEALTYGTGEATTCTVTGSCASQVIMPMRFIVNATTYNTQARSPEP
jgi:hypothetical protein